MRNVATLVLPIAMGESIIERKESHLCRSRLRFDAFMSNINSVIGTYCLSSTTIESHRLSLFIAAFHQAKKRAQEVRESTLQLLTPTLAELD